jgi:hypothetical protein
MAEKTLLGADGNQWLACMTRCPDASADSPVCLPYVFPVHLSLDHDGSCKVSTDGAEPWHGHGSYWLRMSCDTGVSGTLRVVPELRAVRDALIASGLIRSLDKLAGIDGLVVEMTLGGENLFSLGPPAAVGCDRFDYPAGFAVHADEADFSELARVTPGLSQEYERRAKALVEPMVQEVAAKFWARVRATVGARCTLPPKVDEAALKQCVAEHEELGEEVRKLMADMVPEMGRAAKANMDAAMSLVRETIDGPLCAHFAARQVD